MAGNSKHRKCRLNLVDWHAHVSIMWKDPSHEIWPNLAHLETVVHFGFGDVKMVDRVLDGLLGDGPLENSSHAR